MVSECFHHDRTTYQYFLKSRLVEYPLEQWTVAPIFMNPPESAGGDGMNESGSGEALGASPLMLGAGGQGGSVGVAD